MGTFFLLYLIMAIENIAAFFEVFFILACVGLFVWFIAKLIVCDEVLSEKAEEGFKKSFRILVFMFLIGSVNFLIPSQKDMIIIASGTAAYQVITSEKGQELTSKAYGALLRKLDEVGKDIEKVEKAVDVEGEIL